MSQDEEDAIIGRMVREQKELHKRHTLLSEELHRFAEGFIRMGSNLEASLMGGIYSKTLSDTERSLLDATKLDDLLNELRTVSQRLAQLRESLGKI